MSSCLTGVYIRGSACIFFLSMKVMVRYGMLASTTHSTIHILYGGAGGGIIFFAKIFMSEPRHSPIACCTVCC